MEKQFEAEKENITSIHEHNLAKEKQKATEEVSQAKKQLDELKYVIYNYRRPKNNTFFLEKLVKRCIS